MTGRTAYFGNLVRAIFLLAAGAASLAGKEAPAAMSDSPALVCAETSERDSRSSLTFAERVAYQCRIEEVYWRHRIWPKDRPDPKPALDAVMSGAQSEKKVADYLRASESAAEERGWPIRASELQAEMERMARDTKRPEVLSELFAALDNDPFVVAECLARPILAERGSGLSGLRDRLAAIDGTLDITSPIGGPTCLHAEIPCA